MHLEAEAVLVILARCTAGDWEGISSEVVDLEINRTPDPERRRRVGLMSSYARRSVVVGQAEANRAQQLEAWGIPAFDALHLACAESAGVDVLLTTDDRLLRQTAAHAGQLQVRVANPLAWLGEVS